MGWFCPIYTLKGSMMARSVLSLHVADLNSENKWSIVHEELIKSGVVPFQTVCDKDKMHKCLKRV
jgi:hypothetical protein